MTLGIKNLQCIFLIYEIISLILCFIMPDKIIRYKKKTEKDTLNKKRKNLFLALVLFIHSLLSYSIIFNTLNFNTNDIKVILQNIIILILLMIIEWITLIDIRTRIIPNILLLSMLILITIYKCLSVTNIETFFNEFVPSVFSMLLVVSGILFLNSLFGSNYIFGSGDIKYLGVGAYLCGHMAQISSLLSGFAIGTFGIIFLLLILRKITLKSVIPFGPMISIGFINGLLAVITNSNDILITLLNSYKF